MCDLPENLIKREPSPQSEELSPQNTIKAKLNLHVKRRIHNIKSEEISNSNEVRDESQVPQKEIKKQKRPYHKRQDKAKANANAEPGISAVVTPTRKYKHKLKNLTTTGNPDSLTPNSGEETNAFAFAAGNVSAGDDDDGSHDTEMRTGREREKCADVLSLVLSMKKRSLMQNPEIQSFLQDIMKEIKS